MKVCFIKLRTGDELIAEYSVEGETATITNPVRLAMEPESGAIRFVPYPIVGVSPVVITMNIADILFDIPTGEACDSSYRKSFGHVIEVVKPELFV